jgi:hypothetical protein
VGRGALLLATNTGRIVRVVATAVARVSEAHAVLASVNGARVAASAALGPGSGPGPYGHLKVPRISEEQGRIKLQQQRTCPTAEVQSSEVKQASRR